MKIELDPRTESAIRSTLPPDGAMPPLFLNGRLETAIRKSGMTAPRFQYSKDDLEKLGYMTADAILRDIHAWDAREPVSYHPKDIGIFEGYVCDARAGVRKVMDELSIPHPARTFLGRALDGVDVTIDTAGVKKTEAIKDRDGTIHITINVPNVFDIAHFMSRYFGGEYLSQPLFKALVYYDTAHELGHAVHYALGRPSVDAPHAWHDKKLFAGYPLTMHADDVFQQSIADELLHVISNERFAQYFGQEVVHGYGLSRTILQDYARTNALNIFGNGFTFSQMDQFVDGCQKRMYEPDEIDGLSDKDRQDRHNLERSLIDALIIYSVSLYHTYPKDTVEALITKAWRVKRRELADKK